jgi:L-histidine N-alpha-methyltransferase
MARELRAGLLMEPLPTLPCKYFYDERGAQLFDAITRLPEYYQTRTEEAILASIAGEVVDRVRPRELAELGSGLGRKVRVLLDAMRRRRLLESCVLFDISHEVLAESVEALAADYPGVEVRGVVGDFLEDLEALGPGGERLGLFLAGTIGNLHPDEVPAFLRAVADQLERGDGFLVGVDLVKDPARLNAAYNDAAGVTAEFNKNILRVINETFGADFDPEAFEHVAFYDPDNAWIEMRLRARRGMRVRVPHAGVTLRLGPGDEIRTELSCKYTWRSFASRLAGTGLRLDRWFTDPEQLFASALLRKNGALEAA